MSVYFAQGLDGGPIKIGTAHDVPARIGQLEAHYGQPLALLATLEGGRAEERSLHERFAVHRIGRTEQFKPVAEILSFIGLPLLVGADPDAVEVMTHRHMDLRVSPRDHKRLERHAAQLGLSMSSYARMAVLERMKADESREGGPR